MEQILLSSFFELILHVFSLRTRHDANEGECRLLFLTGSPCCLRYFSERGNFWHTYSILWKSLKSGIHERNYKAAFPLQLMNYSWVCLWESEFTDVGLDSFWSQWSTESLSLETICGFSVEIACNKLYFHIPKLARKKKDIGPHGYSEMERMICSVHLISLFCLLRITKGRLCL